MHLADIGKFTRRRLPTCRADTGIRRRRELPVRWSGRRVHFLGGSERSRRVLAGPVARRSVLEGARVRFTPVTPALGDRVQRLIRALS